MRDRIDDYHLGINMATKEEETQKDTLVVKRIGIGITRCKSKSKERIK
jgi:hypothetical protein